jgi:hypothetical protein
VEIGRVVTKYHFFVIDFDSWCLFGFSFILPIFVCWSEILDKEGKKEKEFADETIQTQLL